MTGGRQVTQNSSGYITYLVAVAKRAFALGDISCIDRTSTCAVTNNPTVRRGWNLTIIVEAGAFITVLIIIVTPKATSRHTHTCYFAIFRRDIFKVKVYDAAVPVAG